MVPDTQQKLLDLFLNDISTLAPKGTTRYCRNSWLSIPSQLGRTSRKFQYTRITKGATAKTYQEPLQWLIQNGLVLPCHDNRDGKNAARQQINLHLYPIDTGLCTRMLKIPAYQLLTGEESIANTACTETFLAQQFIQNGYTLSYWSSGNQAEVPFLLSKNNHFIAVDYRITPHQKCRNLMRLHDACNCPNGYTSDDNLINQVSLPANSQHQANFSCSLEQITQMYLLSTEDFKSKEHYQIVPVYATFCI